MFPGDGCGLRKPFPDNSLSPPPEDGEAGVPAAGPPGREPALPAISGVHMLIPSDPEYPAGPGLLDVQLRQRTLFCEGPLGLLKSPSVFFMNSRRPRGGRGGLDWLLATRSLALKAAEAGRVIVCGLGLDSHEAAAQAAAEASAAMIVALEGPVPAALEADRREAFFERNRGLYTPGKTLWISVCRPGDPREQKEVALALRDAIAAGVASLAVAVTIRSGGLMERLALARLGAGMPVEIASVRHLPDTILERLKKYGARVVVAKAGGAAGTLWPAVCQRSDISSEVLAGSGGSAGMDGGAPGGRTEGPAPVAKAGGAGEGAAPAGRTPRQRHLIAHARPAPSPESLRLRWEYLSHYTRAFRGPFPGQSRAEYIRDLAALGRPRNGMDTIRRILAEGRIRASGRLIRGGEPVVSLTELAPWETLEIARWTPHLVRWSFEPYAVCVLREAAEVAGIEPVLYLQEDGFDTLPLDRRFLFQKHRPPDCDWTREKEWRARGDLALSAFPAEALLVLTRTAEEAECIRREFGLAALGMSELGVCWPGSGSAQSLSRNL